MNDVGSISTKSSVKLGKMGFISGQSYHVIATEEALKRFDTEFPDFEFTGVPDEMWKDYEMLWEISGTEYENPRNMLADLNRLKKRGNLKKGDYVINIPFTI